MTDAELLALSRENFRDFAEAFGAMRDNINEHCPMPSAESDFQHGPEYSVSCEVVATAVVTEILRLKAALAEAAR